jgi:hypothetical protein
MTRFGTLVTSTVVAALMGVVPDASGQVRSVLVRADQPLAPIAAALHGSVEGVVTDETGAPIPGATVTASAIGAMSALALSDLTGRFHLYGLQPGAYLVRVHSAGYIASSRNGRQFVEVRPSVRTTISVMLRRMDRSRVVAAGLGSTSSGGEDTQVGDDHSDIAWYLRHLPRSVLKDTTDRDGIAGEKPAPPDADKPGGAARAVPSASRFASSLFDDLPFSGQVNLLTTSSFDTVERLFSSDFVSHSITSLSLGGPVGGWGDWAIQGMTAQGDLGTWFLSGVLKSRPAGSHVYDINIAYSTQRLSPPVPTEFPQTGSESTRAVGSFYAADRWQLSPQVALGYGATYSRYDYLVGPGLFSPRAELTLKPVAHVTIRTSVSRHVLAPGAEEFAPPLLASGLWVPSERTFDWLSNAPLTAEHANNYELTVERDLGHGYSVTARTFFQEVNNQLVALFGRADDPSPLAGSLYHVGPLGDVDAKGWSASVSSTVNRHLRGTVTYQMTTASWVTSNGGGVLGAFAPVAPVARLHDVTTSLETDVPGTETHVFVLYKINTAFANAHEPGPGLDGRFDVQVSQPLPLLDFTAARWQVVFAVRNLFREPSPGASVYDELLVVRPPKRLVGGLVVRF